MMNYGGDFGWMAGMGGLGMFFGLLFWLALMALIVWAVTALFGRSSSNAQTDALDILKRRYAAGEINQGEFETARRTLAA
jgi:putative membrane protein